MFQRQINFLQGNIVLAGNSERMVIVKKLAVVTLKVNKFYNQDYE
jgi:hypothetical protein